MNQTTKIILIIVGAVLLVCGCGAAVVFATGAWSIGEIIQWADQNTSENPQEVAQFAADIVSFDIPQGFDTHHYGMRLGDFTMVQYMTRDERSILFVTQFPAGTSINPDEMMRQIKENSRNPQSPWYNTHTELIEQKTITVRGQETILSISEGTNEQGVLYRVANAKFQGEGAGPALFMLIAPANEFDAQLLDDFIASIR